MQLDNLTCEVDTYSRSQVCLNVSVTSINNNNNKININLYLLLPVK